MLVWVLKGEQESMWGGEAWQGRGENTNSGPWAPESLMLFWKVSQCSWSPWRRLRQVEDEAGGPEPARGRPLVAGWSWHLIFIYIQEPFRILRWGLPWLCLGVRVMTPRAVGCVRWGRAGGTAVGGWGHERVRQQTGAQVTVHSGRSWKCHR